MVEATFPPGTAATYAAGDPDDLAAAILRLVDDARGARGRNRGGRAAIVADLSWERVSVGYLDLVQALARDRR